MSSNEPSWDYYRTFLAVMRGGSFSAAARQLGVAQPTVGRHIETLEKAIAFKLFLRTPQGLVPTESAIGLLPQAEQLAAQAASLYRAVSAHRDSADGSIGGTVRISASDMIGVEVLPPILKELSLRHPNICFELSLSDEVEDVLRHEADIAVRLTEPLQEALVARRLGGLAVGMHAHKEYLEQYGMPQAPGDLSNHRIIGQDRESSFVHSMRKRYPLYERLRPTLKVDSNVAQMALIRAGCGIGFCQVGIARRDPNIVQILNKDFSLSIDTYLVMHENLKRVPSCRVTFDALAEGLKNYLK